MMVDPLFLQPKFRHTGCTVYCNECKSTITDICKEDKSKKKDIKKCTHGEKHVYKVVVYLPNGTKVTRTLKARDPYEASLESSRIKQELKEKFNKGELTKEEEKSYIPQSLIQSFSRYTSYLHNEGVPEHLRRNRSQAHIKDVQHTFELFVECFAEEGIDCNEISVDNLNDKLIGYLYKALLRRERSDRTMNKYFSYGTSLLKWWNEEYYPVRNWFSRIPRKELVHSVTAISPELVMRTLKEISEEKGKQMYPNSEEKPVRNYYWSYSKSGIHFAALTGLRREELATVTWADIHYDSNGVPLFIKVEDLKSNRIRKRQGSKKYKYIPVTNELEVFLQELGLNEKKNDKEYIIAPEVQKNRMKTIPHNLSRSFTHFYDLLGEEKKCTFKSLRKNYLTRLKLYWSNINRLSGHSNERILDEYYLDKEQMAMSMKDFEVLPLKEINRAKELDTIREKSVHPQKQIDK